MNLRRVLVPAAPLAASLCRPENRHDVPGRAASAALTSGVRPRAVAASGRLAVLDAKAGIPTHGICPRCHGRTRPFGGPPCAVCAVTVITASPLGKGGVK